MSALQIKVESEINKAQRMISEKDTELHNAEVTLSGLVEVFLFVNYYALHRMLYGMGMPNTFFFWILHKLIMPSMYTYTACKS